MEAILNFFRRLGNRSAINGDENDVDHENVDAENPAENWSYVKGSLNTVRLKCRQSILSMLWNMVPREPERGQEVDLTTPAECNQLAQQASMLSSGAGNASAIRGRACGVTLQNDDGSRNDPNIVVINRDEHVEPPMSAVPRGQGRPVVR